MIILFTAAACCLEVFPHFFKLLRRIEGIIGMTFADQLFGILTITFFSLTLPVRAQRTTMQGALIRLQTTPGQAIENIIFGPGNISALVGIFYADNELTPVLSGKKVVEKDGPDPSQVQPPCRRRGKADPYF
jgi:hypothetical protein